MSDKKIKKATDEFLDANTVETNEENKTIKGDKSLVERVNKKIITEDGRQLLF